MESQTSELKLVSNVKSHKKGFYRYSGKQRENKWYRGQLTDTGHAKGWCSQCLLHLSIYWQGQASWASMPSGRWDVLPTVAEHQSRDHLHKLVTYKRVDGTRWDPSEWTLRNQVKAIARLLSVIFEKAQQSGKVPITRKKANAPPLFKKESEN